jgi:hypothetical protein
VPSACRAFRQTTQVQLCGTYLPTSTAWSTTVCLTLSCLCGTGRRAHAAWLPFGAVSGSAAPPQRASLHMSVNALYSVAVASERAGMGAPAPVGMKVDSQASPWPPGAAARRQAAGAGAAAAAAAHSRLQAGPCSAADDQALQARRARSLRSIAARRQLRDAGEDAAPKGPAPPALLGGALQAALILTFLCACGAALCCCIKCRRGRCAHS